MSAERVAPQHSLTIVEQGDPEANRLRRAAHALPNPMTPDQWSSVHSWRIYTEVLAGKINDYKRGATFHDKLLTAEKEDKLKREMRRNLRP